MNAKQNAVEKLSLQIPGSKKFFTIDKSFFTQEQKEPKVKESKIVTRIDHISPVISLLDYVVLEKYINNSLDGDFYYKVQRTISLHNNVTYTFIEHESYIKSDLVVLQIKELSEMLLNSTVQKILDTSNVE
jgi:hypothetical protein